MRFLPGTDRRIPGTLRAHPHHETTRQAVYNLAVLRLPPPKSLFLHLDWVDTARQGFLSPAFSLWIGSWLDLAGIIRRAPLVVCRALWRIFVAVKTIQTIFMDIYLEPSAWRGYRRASFPSKAWTVEGEALRAFGHGAQVDLISRQRFGDFDLSFEWRLPVGGNSGLLYRVTEDHEAAWQSGPEMQLLDNSVHPDGRVPETSCGALYALYAPQGRFSCPAGLFNIARVSVRGSRVEHWLNGARVLACDLASEEFRRRVANSKFDHFSQFARATEGHLVLQHHGTDAWFRDIRISTA